jgi:hypothetical protein
MRAREALFIVAMASTTARARCWRARAARGGRCRANSGTWKWWKLPAAEIGGRAATVAWPSLGWAPAHAAARSTRVRSAAAAAREAGVRGWCTQYPQLFPALLVGCRNGRRRRRPWYRGLCREQRLPAASSSVRGRGSRLPTHEQGEARTGSISAATVETAQSAGLSIVQAWAGQTCGHQQPPLWGKEQRS